MADYIDGFAVTKGHKIEAKIAEFEAEQEDYQAIMLEVLADRLAEAFAEHSTSECEENIGPTNWRNRWITIR